MIDFKTKTQNPNFDHVFDIHPQELLEKVTEVKVIDVRQPDEFTGELSHIAQAELLVLDTLPEKIESLPKDKTIVFVCRSGGRSARASDFAIQNGFKNVFNMQGGMLYWNQLGLPIHK